MDEHADEIYTPLKASQKEIRLLQILSDDRGTEVRCRLHTVSMNDNPCFVALSYVWGGSSKRTNISLNGRQVSVTASLESALRHFKSHFPNPQVQAKEPWVWADAICINQSDNDERSDQVQNVMRQIYEQAEMTMCWLGPKNDDIIAGLQAMDEAITNILEAIREARYTRTKQKIRRLCTRYERYLPERLIQYNETFQTAPEAFARAKLRVDWSWMQQYDLFGPESWEKMMHLNSLPYWTRAWIFQEMAMAKVAIITCGKYMVDLTRITMLPEFFETLLDKRPSKCPTYMAGNLWLTAKGIFPPSWTIWMLIIKFRKNAAILEVDKAVLTQSAWDVLLNVKALQATDPRDLVYALQGILAREIEVDYNKSVVDVLKDLFSCYLLDFPGSLNILSYAGIGYDTLNDDWPSWVPGTRVKRGELLPGCRPRHVSKNTPPNADVVDQSTIKVEGATVAIINNIHPCFEVDFVQDETFHTLLRKCQTSRKDGIVFLPWIVSLARILLGYKEPLLDSSTISSITYIMVVIMLADDELHPCQERIQKVKHDVTLAGLKPKQSVADFIWKILWPLSDQKDKATASKCVRVLKSDVVGAERDTYIYSHGPDLVLAKEKLSHLRLFWTDQGHFGIAPPRTQMGDQICLVEGYDTIAVDRPVGEHYRLVGECFVDGLVNGEAEDLLKDGKICYEPWLLR